MSGGVSCARRPTTQSTMKTIGIKIRSSHPWLAAVIGVLGIVGGARERAWANDLAFRDVVRNTDFLSAGIGGLRNVGSGTITLRGMTGEVHQAWLYWAGPSNTTNTSANASITLNGRAVRGEQIGFTSDNCWGFLNSQAYRADVTDIVAAKGNGTYAIAGLLKQGTNINANGVSLLVFYNDAIDANDRDIVIYDGNDSNSPNAYDMSGWNVRLAGIHYTSGTGSIQLHVSDGQSYKDSAVVVNGRSLLAAGSVFQGATLPSANNGPMNNGDLWDIKKLDVTPILTAGTNTLQMTHRWLSPGGDCVAIVVAAIDLPAGAAPDPGRDLTNNPPSILADLEVTIHTPNPVVVHADVTDIDGDPLTTAISVDGVLRYTGAIVKGSPMTKGSLRLTNSYALGDHMILFAVSDGDLSGSCVMALRVVDNTPPTITVPANITVPTDAGRSTAIVRFTATATDDFPGEVNVVCLPLPGSAFPIGVTMVNCTATDRTGNAARGSFTITVTDALPPTIACPGDLIQPAARGANASVVTFVVPFTDNHPGATLTCVPPSGSVFPMGMSPVACIARDAAGNTAACSFKVILMDAEPPVILCPTNFIAGNDLGKCSAVVNYSVNVNDNGPGVTLRCVPPPGSVFPLGTSIVNCVAVDAAGNSASNSFRVIIKDTEKPMLALPIDIVAPLARRRANAVVNYSVTATDNCSTPVVCCVPRSGSVFPAGTTLVRCTATDAAGNMTAGSFQVIVRDTEPPVIKYIKVTKKRLSAPGHGTHAIAPRMYAITLRVSATDNYGPVTSRIVSITSTTAGSTPSDWQITGPLTATLKAGRVYIIKVEARDAAGNVAYGTTTVSLSQGSSHGDVDDDDCGDGTRPHTSGSGVPSGSH